MLTDLQLEFLNYHNASSHIYQAYRDYAFELHRAGVRRKSISMITERIRWFSATRGTGEFKIKNSCRAGYARLLMWREPELCFEGSFSLKPSTLDGFMPVRLYDLSTWDTRYWNLFE